MGETLELYIEKLVQGGEGLGRHADRVVFVPHVIPGETVRVAITENRKNFQRGRVVEIIEPSPARREPFCSYFGRCGGCQLQHMSYHRQMEEKLKVLRETLRRIGGLAVGQITAVPSPEKAYRIRVRLHQGADGRLGFMERQSGRIIPIDSCPVCVEPVNRVIARGMRADTKVAAGDMTTETLTLLSTDRGVVSSRDRESARLESEITVANRPIRCSAKTFFQSSLCLLPQMVAHGIDGLSGNSVLDLYCGVGLFGCFLADSFEEVIAVDRDPRAVSLAGKNVKGGKHRFFAQPVEKWVRRGRREVAAAVVDPARPGLAEPVREYLRFCTAGEVVYVSCNPATLARDLASLCRTGGDGEGFVIRDIRLFDFFPQTHHMEIVVRLTRAFHV
jgi:23S rRNA (uracil1939-C5)-methyltransferase